VSTNAVADDRNYLWVKFRDIFLSDPQIWKLFHDYSFDVLNSGWSDYSARDIFGRLRWHVHIETSDPDFKLNNVWSPYYSRMFMWVYPGLGPSCWADGTQRPWGVRKPLVNDGFFELRTVDTNLDVESEIFGWAQNQRSDERVLFKLKRISRGTCEADSCICADIVAVPGDLWGLASISLCHRHAELAVAYAERNNL